MEQKILFNAETDINASFLKDIPGIGAAKYGTHDVTKKADSMEVYLSTFSEKFIEKDRLLEYTELNDFTNISTADYWDIHGYSQNLYMLKYHFEWLSRASKKSVPVDAVIFFSEKKNRDDSVIGVTSCYFGIIDTAFKDIDFNTQLAFKKQGNGFYLKPGKPNKNLHELLFMPAVFPDLKYVAPDSTITVNIKKIVRLDPNKVGGVKPLVFDIGKIFLDDNALLFHYVNTISLK